MKTLPKTMSIAKKIALPLTPDCWLFQRHFCSPTKPIHPVTPDPSCCASPDTLLRARKRASSAGGHSGKSTWWSRWGSHWLSGENCLLQSKAEMRWEGFNLSPTPGISSLIIVKMHGNSMLYTKRSTGFVNVTTQRTKRCIYTTCKNKKKGENTTDSKVHRPPIQPPTSPWVVARPAVECCNAPRSPHLFSTLESPSLNPSWEQRMAKDLGCKSSTVRLPFERTTMWGVVSSLLLHVSV